MRTIRIVLGVLGICDDAVGSYGGQGSEILAALDEAAQSKGERIAVELEQPDHTDVYAAGDFGGTWYNTIAPGSPVHIHDLTELPDKDPRQLLQLSGGEDFKNTVYGILDAHSAQHQELESLEWSFLFTDTALAGIYFLILATCFAVVVAGTRQSFCFPFSLSWWWHSS